MCLLHHVGHSNKHLWQYHITLSLSYLMMEKKNHSIVKHISSKLNILIFYRASICASGYKSCKHSRLNFNNVSGTQEAAGEKKDHLHPKK